jgi:hypothetical protein
MSSVIGLKQRLFTMKCYLCCEAERACSYLMLPSDCVASPVVSLCFRDEEGKPSAIEVRAVDGGALEVFVQQSAVIKADTTRHNNLSGHPVYRKGKQFFYRVDADLLGRLKAKQSKVAAHAAQRLEALMQNVGLNRDALVCACKERIGSAQGVEDVEKIVSVLDWCMRSLADRGVLQQVYDAQGKAYGLSTGAAFLLPEVEHPNCKVYEYRSKEFWDGLMVEARKHFGVKDPDQFKRDQVLGKRRRLATEVVTHRPSIEKYHIHFPDSEVWTNDDDSREWATINRMLWEAENSDTEAVAQFASGLDGEALTAIGQSMPYVMRTEPDPVKGGTVRHVGAFDLLRFGFYAAAIYLCTHQTDNFRRAFLEKNKASLTTKLLQCHLLTDSERREVGFLNLAYDRLVQAATRNVSVRQISVTAAKQGLPSAFEVLRFMHRLETQLHSLPGAKMLLCFLGLAFFCGFRSSDMGRLMVPSYRAAHAGHHNLLVTDEKTGDMWLGSTKCKTVADDIKVLRLPGWLKKWVEDYVLAREEAVLAPAHGETSGTHSCMWYTVSGKAVHRDSGGMPYVRSSDFDYVFDQLRIIGAPEMDKVTCYTDMRSIFFDGSSVDVSGSMLNLFANARDFLPKQQAPGEVHAELRTDVQLSMQEDIKKAMEELNRSKSQAVYTKNRKAPLPFVADYYDAVKQFVWANMK